ncbi:MAG TPA: GDSL-type esterase/lipase family protein [Terracidiphilus sp.]
MKVGTCVFTVLMSAIVAHAQNLDWTIGPFTRPATGNPVIAPNAQSQFADPLSHAPVHWEALHTFNPAAIVRDRKVYVLYRAEDNSGTMAIGMHTSRLGIAESADGIHFTRRATPVFYPAEDDQKGREWPGGAEDPRIVELEDGTYVLTYTQWNRTTYSVGIATSKDLEHWNKKGPAFLAAAGGKYADLKYKSAGIVTRVDAEKARLIAARIDGKYWMYWGEGVIRLASSNDAIHWTPVENAKGDPVELLKPRAGHFDSSFPETGPPPVLTDKGIVVLYNGKNAPAGGDPSMGPNAYAAGEALFDAKDPQHLITQTDQPVLKPELPYEKTGQYAAGTTFAEGLVFFHGKWFLYYGCADSLVAVAVAPGPQPPTDVSRGFYLHPEDRVVFYGDSITEQNYYNQWVQLYTVTRFPKMRVHFYNAGVGGDRVNGGWAGPIDQRLPRDVFVDNPTVITIMLGMNDGGYQPTTPEIDSTYRTGYEHILDSIKKNAPDARITLLGPSPFDDVTAPSTFPGGYNAVMQHFADVDRQLAQEHGATFVNLNPATVAAIEKAQALDPRLAKLLLPDRVHPDPPAHWVMTEALLKGWNAPALVTSVSIDAGGARVSASENTSVDALQHAGDTFTWTQNDNGLPLPLLKENATTAMLLDITDIQKALNQEPLIVTDLAPGQYALRIDDRDIGRFSAEELAAGINLADYNTPMRSQAQVVSWDVRDLVEAHYIHSRMRIQNADTGAEAGGADRLQAFEDSMEDKIYAEAAPVPHHFELKPAGAPAAPSGH